MIKICKFIFNFNNFCVKIRFLTKLLISGTLFSKSDFIAVNAAFVANPLILGISPSISVILAVFLTSPLVSEILFFNSVLSVSYLVFKTNPPVPILFTFQLIFHRQLF